jgi:myo-inositol-1(or 4)-monophosphatase
MNTLVREATFFKEISAKVRSLVESYEGKAEISVQKRSNDYATEVDIAVENLIVDEIRQRFPDDSIMAEEGHSDTVIPDTRIWIIDPICGTTSIGRGITTFCTNIALADKHELIASCVIDHSQNDYYWSIGDGNVFVNDTLHKRTEKAEGAGVVVDVDMGSVAKSLPEEEIKVFTNFLVRLLRDTDYIPMSLNSSLGFAYTSTGRLDGFVNSFCHPWDICASSFLIQQSGGVITGLDGSPWSIETIGAIGAVNTEVHEQLLHLYNQS